jgi:FtsP/CotA-like multicopper oxidase with cupredoxin domain
MKKAAPNRESENFRADVDLELVARPGSAPILPGRETYVWRYDAKLLAGPANTLTAIPSSYLGPIMRFVKGQKIRIRLRNELPERHVTHWHGLHVPELMDGHPDYAIDPPVRAMSTSSTCSIARACTFITRTRTRRPRRKFTADWPARLSSTTRRNMRSDCLPANSGACQRF